MNDKEKVQVIFMILALVELLCILGLTMKFSAISKRVSDLERDYKIYELNLQNLEEHKDVQFE